MAPAFLVLEPNRPGPGAKTLCHLDLVSAWPEPGQASSGWQVACRAGGHKAEQEKVGAKHKAGPAGQTAEASLLGVHPPRATGLWPRSQYTRTSCGRQKAPKHVHKLVPEACTKVTSRGQRDFAGYEEVKDRSQWLPPSPTPGLSQISPNVPPLNNHPLFSVQIALQGWAGVGLCLRCVSGV